MSNYPDNMNFKAFDRTIGSYMTPEEQALEGFKAQTLLAIRDAFRDYPLDTIPQALARWVDIRRDGLDKAYDFFRARMGFGTKRQEEVLDELNLVRDATFDGDMAAVIQAANSYMAIFGHMLDDHRLEQ